MKKSMRGACLWKTRVAGAFLLFCGSIPLSAAMLTGSFSPVATGSNVDLTLAGKIDWVHWGLGTASSINRKWGVPGLISDFSSVGTGSVDIYQYSDNYNGYTWHDGWPVVGATNTTTGVWAYQVYPPTLAGSGFQFTVPAATNQCVLQVFVGTFAARGKFVAKLSDGSAPDYTDTSLENATNGPGVVYAVTYQANSNGPNLIVEWTLDQRVAGTNSSTANVTLQAAALTAAGADNPPLATLTQPADHSAYQAPANISINASAHDFDGTVTNLDFYANNLKLGQAATGPYNFTWSSAPIERYSITAVATDNGGASRSSMPVEVFVYGTGGTLSGSVSEPPAAVDLTAEGTADWTHWGQGTNGGFDYRADVPRQISNFTALGTNTVQPYADNFTAFSWSNGTPTLTSTGTTTGVFITGVTNGFSLSAPADTNSRTLRVYVGCYGAQGLFEAYLSDLSAAPYIDSSVSSTYGNDYAVYALNYAAASAGQRLIIEYHTLELFDYDYGNVTLQSATLQGEITSVPVPVHLVEPKMLGSDFVFSFMTQSNLTYVVEYADQLPATNWLTLLTLPGTGALTSVTNQAATRQRFYQVQTQ